MVHFSVRLLVACHDSLLPSPCQVVELLNQAALISTDEKLTVLKQVCCHFQANVLLFLVARDNVKFGHFKWLWIFLFCICKPACPFFQVQELIINKDPSLLDNFLDVSKLECSFAIQIQSEKKML